MKTIKLTTIAIVLTFAMVSVSFAGESGAKTAKKAIKMNIEQTANLPGLVQVMHLQLDPDFMNTFRLVYTVDVDYRNYTVKVTGTYIQWSFFFNPNVTQTSHLKHVEVKR